MIKPILILLLLSLLSCAPQRPADTGSIGLIPPAPISGPLVPCPASGDVVIRESGSTLRDCTVRGVVRVRGQYGSANEQPLRELSRRADYVAMIRASAPSWVTLSNVTIESDGRIPLYVGPGVTSLRLEHVTIRGASDSVMVYLDAESSGTIADGLTIDASRASREAIAIDASDRNLLVGLKITGAKHGGIYLYRNCGEADVTRVTTPSGNLIEGEVEGVQLLQAAVWIGSREGRRNYCDSDSDGTQGSAVSDLDWARRNVVQVRTRGAIRKGRSASGNDIEP